MEYCNNVVCLFELRLNVPVMSGRCLYFMGLLPKMRMPWHPASAKYITIQQSHKDLYLCGRFDSKPLFLGRLRPERLPSNQSVSRVQALSGGTNSPSITMTLNFTKIYMPTCRTRLYSSVFCIVSLDKYE